MFNYIYNKLVNIITKNKTAIPLLAITFDYVKFQNTGKVGSCQTRYHPVLKDDKILQHQLQAMIDGIRERYDMEEMI